MVGASKILTVSYGTFSCTLEGFDEPFNTMKAIAEYFRDLAAEDRYFGAEPPTPDAEMLHRIAEREIHRRVEAKIQENGIVLRAGDSDTPTAMPAPEAAPAPSKPVAASAVAQVEAPKHEAHEPKAEPAAAAAVPEQAPAPAAKADPEAIPFETAALAAAGAVAGGMAPPMAESIAAKLARIRAAVEQARKDAEAHTPDAELTEDLEDAAAPPSSTLVAEAVADPKTPVAEDLAPAESVAEAQDAPVSEKTVSKEAAAETPIAEAPVSEASTPAAQPTEPVAEAAPALDAETADAKTDDTKAAEAARLAEKALDVHLQDTISAVTAALKSHAAAPAGEPAAQAGDDSLARPRARVIKVRRIEPEAPGAAPVIETEHMDPAAAEAEREAFLAAQAEAAAKEEAARKAAAEKAEAERKAAEAVAAAEAEKRAAEEAAKAKAEQEAADTAAAAEAKKTSVVSTLDPATEAELQAELAAIEQDAAGTTAPMAEAVAVDVHDETLDDAELPTLVAQEAELPELTAPVETPVAEATAEEPVIAAPETAETETEDAAHEETAPEEIEPEALEPEQAAPEEAKGPVAESAAPGNDQTEETPVDSAKPASGPLTLRLSEMAGGVVAAAAARFLPGAKAGRDAEQRQDLLKSDVDADGASMDRLIKRSDAESNEPEARRRQATLSHLKAAVVATQAEKELAPEDTEDTKVSELERYRDDLAQVVRPRRPVLPTGSTTARPEAQTERPAPLVLVSEQRVDRAGEPSQPMVIRPRRVTSAAAQPALDDEDEAEDAENIFANSKSFAEFAERLGATDLQDLLEAAAAYASCVEGRPYFSRPQILRSATEAADVPVSREQSLRSFGMLLRQGKIQKVKRGQFAIAASSRYLNEARKIAQ